MTSRKSGKQPENLQSLNLKAEKAAEARRKAFEKDHSESNSTSHRPRTRLAAQNEPTLPETLTPRETKTPARKPRPKPTVNIDATTSANSVEVLIREETQGSEAKSAGDQDLPYQVPQESTKPPRTLSQDQAHTANTPRRESKPRNSSAGPKTRASSESTDHDFAAESISVSAEQYPSARSVASTSKSGKPQKIDSAGGMQYDAVVEDPRISTILVDEKSVPASHAEIPNFQEEVSSRTEKPLHAETQDALATTPTDPSIALSSSSEQAETSSWSTICTWVTGLLLGIKDRIIGLALSFPRWLKWIPALIAVTAAVVFLSIFVMILALLFWFLIWTFTLSMGTLDNATNVICHWVWLSPICSYGCSVSPWVIVYLFFNTCSQHISRENYIAEPYWEAGTDFSETSNIPRILAFHESRCNYFTAKIPRIRQDLPISEDDKDRLISVHNYICSHMSNSSHELPAYYRHVNIFSESLLRQVNVIEEQIGTALTDNFSRNALAEQRSLEERSASFISTWQRRYEFLEAPGKYMVDGLNLAREKIAEHRSNLENVRTKTVRARDERIKAWNLPRRFLRHIRVLRSEPPELYSYNDVIDCLDESIIEIRTVDAIYTLIWNNVTELSRHLSDFAGTKLSADMHSQLGSEGLLQLQSRIMSFKPSVQGIKKTIDGAQVIESDENSQ